ncbi:hypothetical protein [Seohaeicola zhoushanensis]|uniref:Transmembrane protein n=1 Tax=Seohaeicola zhoushanensis TaxID=1569283 RepID=A0A8J3GV25_9RHOB|nr:hypothetical protein [Seohaeicola zhoushanensis]GHF38160.1 hypothetical protein GCM10017056_07640 [Seohaeicola zhoushanensis]
MKRALFQLMTGLGLALIAATGLAAQTRNCAPRDIVVERLADGYGESRQSIGLGAQGAVIEVFASNDTGTWTITVTTPAGLTCLVASGQSFQALAEVLPKKDKGA